MITFNHRVHVPRSTPVCCSLVTILGQLVLSLLVTRALLCLGELPPCNLLPLVVCSTLDLASLLKSKRCVSMILLTVISMLLSYLATTSWYFHPTSWLRRPTVQYLRPGFNLSILRACGTTILCFLSYGGGIPSKTFNLSIAAAPRGVLCGIMPRTVL
jgi:hypothetical protein